MEWRHSAFVLCIILAVLASEVCGKKILLLPPARVSFIISNFAVADGLIKMGHEVHTILDAGLRLPADVIDVRVKRHYFDTGVTPFLYRPEFHEDLNNEELDENYWGFRRYLACKYVFVNDEECRQVLGNETLAKELSAERFDFAVVFQFARCFMIVPYRLGIPFGIINDFLPLDVPDVASQGQFLLRAPYDHNVYETGLPFVVTKVFKVWHAWTAWSEMQSKYLKYTNTSLWDIQKTSEIWLYDNSGLLNPSTVPAAPNSIEVGGLTTKRSKPLSGRLKTFLDSATQGCVLITFGTVIGPLPESLLDILLQAIAEIKLKVVLKWNTDSLARSGHKLPDNIFVAKWLPQNDILGHPNVKLFVTHCGNNGQHQALYHGVPMLGIPLFADQVYNAERIQSRGYGLFIRVWDLNKEKLVNAINLILANQNFSENIKRASLIFRSQPMDPKTRAAFWIDHVMKYGGQHLKSATRDMSWFEILMFDVALFLCFLVFIACVVLVMTITFCRQAYLSVSALKQKLP